MGDDRFHVVLMEKGSGHKMDGALRGDLPLERLGSLLVRKFDLSDGEYDVELGEMRMDPVPKAELADGAEPGARTAAEDQREHSKSTELPVTVEVVIETIDQKSSMRIIPPDDVPLGQAIQALEDRLDVSEGNYHLVVSDEKVILSTVVDLLPAQGLHAGPAVSLHDEEVSPPEAGVHPLEPTARGKKNLQTKPLSMTPLPLPIQGEEDGEEMPVSSTGTLSERPAQEVGGFSTQYIPVPQVPLPDHPVTPVIQPPEEEDRGEVLFAQLAVQTGSMNGKVFPIVKSETMVGRNQEADIYLGDPGISRQHARLSLYNEEYVLEDMDSLNGTFVNGQQLFYPQVVNDGDLIWFGPQVIVLFKLIYREAGTETVTGL